MKNIDAFFLDFDHTIIRKDSMFLFLFFYLKKTKMSFLIAKRIIMLIYFALLYLLDFDEKISVKSVKNRLFSIIKHSNKSELKYELEAFFNLYFDKIFNYEFLNLLNLYPGSRFYIISASPDIFIESFINVFVSKYPSISVRGYGSKFVFLNNSIFITNNLKGVEKSVLLDKIIKEEKILKPFAIGDSKEDIHMVKICKNGLVSKRPISKFLEKFYGKIIK